MTQRLDALRKLMIDRGIDAYLLPRTDEFQGEYVAEYAERLRYLTGFSGSAGFAIVTQKSAAFFTDGRYTLQAESEVPQAFERFDISQKKPVEWLTSQIPTKKVGFDPKLFTPAQIDIYKNCECVAITPNLIDEIWEDQPSPPQFFVQSHGLLFAGESDQSKRERIAQEMKGDLILFTLSDSIAWLLNIRGRDVPHTPVCHCYVLMDRDGQCDIFINLHKINGEAYNQLHGAGRMIDITKMEEFLADLPPKRRIQLDDRTCPVYFCDLFKSHGHEIIHQPDPCLLPKAIKNEAELRGAREAHIRDGVALVEFMAWLAEQPLEGETTELSCVEKLLHCRNRKEYFKDLSFDTIAGFGPNGAIIHYRADEKSNLPLCKDNLFLLDSGAQYLDGTTDVTRTIALCTPSDEHREMYTRVLQGHIAIARATFPKGTSGAQLDALARMPLWEIGRDYAHGTGHGVGSYLSVHEGPQGISKGASNVPLQPGMILSNEPGFYKEGEYGIRIESLVIVTVREDLGKHFMGFETITMAPLDRKLIEVSLLSPAEREWVNAYQKQVYETLARHLPEGAKAWLADECQPL